MQLAKQFPHVSLVPAPDVDEIWHAHILFTVNYTMDCHRVFGHYVHHIPTVDPIERASGDKYKATLELYEKTFGERPAVWFGVEPKDGCDGCDRGCSAASCRGGDACNA